MIIYVDTSAAKKLLVEEKESAVLADHLQRHTQDGDTLVASLQTPADCARPAGPAGAADKCQFPKSGLPTP
jgi:hypothetical protein